MTDGTESTFGDYRLLERIGVGGMAEAYLALRKGANHPCVLKLIREGSNAVAQARMRREAHAGIHLSHPNIVRTLDAGTVSGTFYVAVELIVGVDLRHIATWSQSERRSLEVDAVVGILRQALAGLAYAHAAVGPDGAPLSLVHRDLSPANLMVDDAGRVKLIDFGLVRADIDDGRTEAGMVLGTLAYLSPEQAVGDPIDARADLYMLSAVAYELLTGSPVARGTDATSRIRSIIADAPPPILALRPDVPEALAAEIHRGLAKDKRTRHVHANAYLDALAPFDGADASALGALVLEVSPDLLDRRDRWTSLGNEPTQIATRAEVPKPAPARRIPVGWIGAGLASLGVAATVGVFASRPRPAAVEVVPVVAPKEAPAVVQRVATEAPPPKTAPPPKVATKVPVAPRKSAAPARKKSQAVETAPPADAPSAKTRLTRLDARLRRLESAGVDVDELRAKVRLVRAAEVPPAAAIDALERDTSELEHTR